MCESPMDGCLNKFQKLPYPVVGIVGISKFPISSSGIFASRNCGDVLLRCVDGIYMIVVLNLAALPRSSTRRISAGGCGGHRGARSDGNWEKHHHHRTVPYFPLPRHWEPGKSPLKLELVAASTSAFVFSMNGSVKLSSG